MSATPTDPTNALSPGNALPPNSVPGPGSVTPPASTAAPVAPAAPKPSPDDDGTITMSSKKLSERLERERNTLLKALGFDSLEQAQQLRDQVEANRVAQMTKEQQLEEENARLKRERDEAVARSQSAEFDVTLVQRCAERGIRDVDYARYLVKQAGTVADVGVFLDEQSQDPRKKVALGIEEPPATVVPAPITTTAVNPNLPPPPPAPTNGNGAVDVMKLPKAEADKYMREKYGA